MRKMILYLFICTIVLSSSVLAMKVISPYPITGTGTGTVTVGGTENTNWPINETSLKNESGTLGVNFWWLTNIFAQISDLPGDVYVNESGDTMTGDLDMNSNNIINANNVNATTFYGDGSKLTGIAGDNSSWNKSYADTLYVKNGSIWNRSNQIVSLANSGDNLSIDGYTEINNTLRIIGGQTSFIQVDNKVRIRGQAPAGTYHDILAPWTDGILYIGPGGGFTKTRLRSPGNLEFTSNGATVRMTLDTSGNLWIDNKVIAGGDLVTTGVSDDLWLGDITKSVSKFVGNADGSLAIADESFNVSTTGDLAVGGSATVGGNEVCRMDYANSGTLKATNFSGDTDDFIVVNSSGEETFRVFENGMTSYLGAVGYPVLYIPFRFNGGSVVGDWSSLNNQGLIDGANWNCSGAKVGGCAMNFDGTDDEIIISNHASLNPDYITISSWIYTKRPVSDSSTDQIVSKDDSSTGNRVWQFALNPSEYITFAVFKTDVDLDSVTGDINVNDGNWHHVAGTWDGSTIRIYVDGVEDANKTYAGSLQQGQTNDVLIGSADVSTLYFNGTIDEVRIYPRALTATEIQAIYDYEN